MKKSLLCIVLLLLSPCVYAMKRSHEQMEKTPQAESRNVRARVDQSQSHSDSVPMEDEIAAQVPVAPVLSSVSNNSAIIQRLIEKGAQAQSDIAPMDTSDKEQLEDEADPVIVAVHAGDITSLKKYIENKANLNKTNKSGQTPLMLAVIDDSAEMAKLLLDAGADINAADKTGNTALAWAVQHDKITLVALLISAKANVNTVDLNGVTPLMVAAVNGNSIIISYLLKARAQAAVKDKAGSTALMRAVKSNNEQAVNLLVRCPGINAKDKTERCALTIALTNDVSTDIIKLLLKAGAHPLLDRVDVDTKKLQTPVMLARKLKNKEHIELLEAEEEECNKRAQEFVNLLSEPVHPDTYEKRAENILKEKKCTLDQYLTFLASRLNPNHLCDYLPVPGTTPQKIRALELAISYATQMGNNTEPTIEYKKMVVYMALAALYKNTATNALTSALRSGNKQLINWLLTKDVDINKALAHAWGSSDWSGPWSGATFNILDKELVQKIMTVPSFDSKVAGPVLVAQAFQKKDKDLINELLKQNITLQRKYTDLFNKLIRSEGLELVELAIKAKVGITNGQDRFKSLVQTTDEIASLVLEAGFDVNYKSTLNNTVLHEAVRNNKRNLVKMLIDYKADVNAQTKKGLAPLKIAATHGHYKVTSSLLSCKDLVIDIQDEDGCTPLCIAAFDAHPEIVELLLKAKANPNVQDKEGESILMHALSSRKNRKANKTEEIVELLLEAGADTSQKDKDGKTVYEKTKTLTQLLNKYKK